MTYGGPEPYFKAGKGRTTADEVSRQDMLYELTAIKERAFDKAWTLLHANNPRVFGFKTKEEGTARMIVEGAAACELKRRKWEKEHGEC